MKPVGSIARSQCRVHEDSLRIPIHELWNPEVQFLVHRCSLISHIYVFLNPKVHKISRTVSAHGLCSPKVQCRVHKGSLIIPILSRVSPISHMTPIPLLISPLILPSHRCLDLPNILFPVGLSFKFLNHSYILSHSGYCLAHPNLLDLTILTLHRQGEKSSSNLKPMWNSGQATVGYGPGQELVSPPHWGKAFLIEVHGWIIISVSRHTDMRLAVVN